MSSPKNSQISVSMLAMFAGGLMLVSFFAIILQQIAAPEVLISFWLFCFGLGIYIFSGIYAKTMLYSTFTNANKKVEPVFGGMAIAAAAISCNLILLLPGETYFSMDRFLVHFVGTILGLTFATIFFSATFARSNAATLPELVFPQRSSVFLLVIGSLTVGFCCLTLLLAQLKLVGIFVTPLFNMNPEIGSALLIVFATICLVLGGMQSLGVVRAIGFVGIVICFLFPLAWLAFKITGNPIPQFAFGTGALLPVLEIDRELIEAGIATPEELSNPLANFGSQSVFSIATSVLVLAGGIAAMPNLLQHFLTVQKGSPARFTGMWAFWMVVLVLTAVPALSVFTQYNIYTSILGLQLGELATETPWVYSISGAGSIPFLKLCGEFVQSTGELISACGQPIDGFLSIQDIEIQPEFLLLASGIVAELPFILTVFAGLAALFAVMTTIDGLILVTANTLTADFYGRIIRPKSPPGIRLFMNRFFIIGFAITLIYVLPLVPFDSQTLFVISITTGCATLFPLLIGRLWLSRFNDLDLGAGMIVSLIVCLTLTTIALQGAATSSSGIASVPMWIGLAGFVSFWISTVITHFSKTVIRRKLQGRQADAAA